MFSKTVSNERRSHLAPPKHSTGQSLHSPAVPRKIFNTRPTSSYLVLFEDALNAIEYYPSSSKSILNILPQKLTQPHIATLQTILNQATCKNITLCLDGMDFSDLALTTLAFSQVSLNEAKFDRCLLNTVIFCQTPMKSVSFSNATLQNVYFDEAAIHTGDFSNSKLSSVYFESGDLVAPTTTNSTGSNVGLSRVNLHGTNFTALQNNWTEDNLKSKSQKAEYVVNLKQLVRNTCILWV